MTDNGLEARFNAAREIARDADRDVEALISSRLMALFPDDGFIGEETGVGAGGWMARLGASQGIASSGVRRSPTLAKGRNAESGGRPRGSFYCRHADLIEFPL